MRRRDFITGVVTSLYHVPRCVVYLAGGTEVSVMKSLCALLVVVVLTLSVSPVALAQQQPGGGEQVFGVFVDPSGTLRQRTVDAKELNLVRARARAATDGKTAGGVHFVSLNKLLAEARKHVEQNQPLPDSIKYLEGLTQVRYVFVYPQEKDLVIAGAAEEIDKGTPLQPRGKTTGRPVLQFDDLIVAMRMARDGGRMEPIGCSIDLPPNTMEVGKELRQKYSSGGGGSVGQMMKELAERMGPQSVRYLGVPPDTRIAFVCVAADYKLKRYSHGVEPAPVPGIGHGVDNSRVAANGWWFEASYEPLLVSADNNSFEFRGQRLQLKAGGVPFDEKGATEKAKQFAKNFTAKLPQMAALNPLFADLQNVTDLALLAALVRHDKLDERAGLDLSFWKGPGYSPAPVPTARSADTIVNHVAGSVVAGGVKLKMTDFLNAREPDQGNALAEVRTKRKK